MSRELLNADKWDDIVRELHSSDPGVAPEQLSEKQEFARRQHGSVNVYIWKLKIENATLRRRVRMLERILADYTPS
jgi:hypothetical protein